MNFGNLNSLMNLRAGEKSPFNPKNISGLNPWYRADQSVYANGAAQFTAADKHWLTIPTNATLQAGAGNFEIGVWVYLDSKATTQNIIGKWGTGNNREYMIRYNTATDRFNFYVSNDGTANDGVVADTFGAVTIATWYFIRCWYDGTKIYISVNNGTADSKAWTTGTYASNAAFNVGFDPLNSTYLGGRVDSLYFTKTPSSTAEATALYNAGAGRMVGDLTAANGLATFRTNCISWWGMNEDTGIRYDQIGTNHLTPAATDLINPTTLNGGFETRTANRGLSTNVSTVNVARASNVATIEATAHGLVNNDVCTIASCTDTTFNATNVTVTRVDDDHFTYANTGSDSGEAADTTGRITTDIFANWTETPSGSSTINAETAAPYAGTYACRFDVDASNSDVYVSQAGLTIGNKYKATLYAKASSGTPSLIVGYFSQITLTTSYALYTVYFTASSTTFYLEKSTGCTSKSIYIDNVTIVNQGPGSAAGIAAGLASDGNLCAQFNGTSQYLSVASNATLQTGDIDFTVWGWVNLNNKTATQYFVSKYTTSGNLREYSLNYDVTADKFSFVTSPDGTTTGMSTVYDTTLGSPSVGTWYFIVAWHDSVANKIWISTNNGTPISANHTTGLTALTGAFNIGTIGGGGFFLAGRADGVGFIKRTLTAGEITSLYNIGKGCKYADLPTSISGDSLLKGFWNLDAYSAGTGAVTRSDSTANANNLTDTGTTPSGQGVKYYEGAVGKWLDQSGNAVNLTQLTQANKLLWRTNQLNSLPALTGDGLTKSLSNATDLIGTGNVTVFAVIKPRGYGGGNLGRVIDNSKMILMTATTNSQIRVSSDGGSTAAGSAVNSITLGTACVVIVTRTSANPGLANIYINGVLSGSADQSSGTPAAGTPTYLGNNAGGTRGFDGDIFEVGVYSKILTATQIASLNRYLKLKYAL